MIQEQTMLDVADNSDLTIMQLLSATASLTDDPDNLIDFASIYDGNGDGTIDAGYFLLPMAGAAIVAMSMAIWGGMEATRAKQKFEPVIFAPMIIVLSGVVMLFVVAALRDSFN